MSDNDARKLAIAKPIDSDKWTSRLSRFAWVVVGHARTAETPPDRVGARARDIVAKSDYQETAAAALSVLLDEIQGGVKHRREQNRVIETKAASVVTLASAIIAFTASFRSAALFSTIPGWVGIGLAVLAIIGAVSALWPVRPRRSAPHVLEYLDATTLNRAESGAQVLADLVVDWESYCGELARIVQIRTARLNVSYIVILLALIAILAAATYAGASAMGAATTNASPCPSPSGTTTPSPSPTTRATPTKRPALPKPAPSHT